MFVERPFFETEDRQFLLGCLDMGKVFIINDDGSKREVINIQELQELARQGAVLPETKIEAKGRVVNAGKIKELTGVFIATRIRRQNAEKAGGAAVNDAPEVNGASPVAFKALEDFGSVPPADTALPPVADSAVEGALYAGEMEIPEEFKPKPEAVKKAKQKPDDAFEAFQAKYNILHIDEAELENVVNAKYKKTIKYITRAMDTFTMLRWFSIFSFLLSPLVILSLGEGSHFACCTAGVVFLASVTSVMVSGAASLAFRFTRDTFISRCKDSLKREIYLAELLRKNGE